ncbi:hypothetical protein [Actinomadura macrotermitis]|uniref:Uncharacterized protein n=1 Tax=Actinomadura macrotermitis TaxID=2585200 RepID=A0A7K0C810_9ACTN|nr:hypothetical protein [Actinomadura macrotermitis]MQY09486.1 hypothetical protein [Actinomadura macrotermitis]
MRRLLEALALWLSALVARFSDEPPQPRAPISTWFTSRLPSSVPEASFQVKVGITWPPLSVALPPALKAAAEQQLRDCMADELKRFSVLEAGEAATAVNTVLNRHLRLPYGSETIRLVSAEAEVEPEPGGVELAERLEGLRRDKSAANVAGLAEFERLRVLAEQVLPSPALIRLWWMKGDPARLPEMVQMGDLFERASALVQGRPTPASRQDPLAELFQDLVHGLRPTERELLPAQLHRIFLSFERADLAAALETLNRPAAHPASGFNGHPTTAG